MRTAHLFTGMGVCNSSGVHPSGHTTSLWSHTPTPGHTQPPLVTHPHPWSHTYTLVTHPLVTHPSVPPNPMNRMADKCKNITFLQFCLHKKNQILDRGWTQITCSAVSNFNHYTRMFSLLVWGCNWILFMHGWFCQIRLILLIGGKSVHFKKKLYWVPIGAIEFLTGDGATSVLERYVVLRFVLQIDM